MGIKTKLKSFFLLDEDDDYDYVDENVVSEEKEIKQASKSTAGKNIVSLQSVQKVSKLVLCEPREYSEAQEIADHLKNRRAVVVNLHRCEPNHARQIVDFLSGTVYAISGEIQKIGAEIFLCTPDNVEVSGNISELLLEKNLQDKGW